MGSVQPLNFSPAAFILILISCPFALSELRAWVCGSLDYVVEENVVLEPCDISHLTWAVISTRSNWQHSREIIDNNVDWSCWLLSIKCVAVTGRVKQGVCSRTIFPTSVVTILGVSMRCMAWFVGTSNLACMYVCWLYMWLYGCLGGIESWAIWNHAWNVIPSFK
jgi:hypothetical protein